MDQPPVIFKKRAKTVNTRKSTISCAQETSSSSDDETTIVTSLKKRKRPTALANSTSISTDTNVLAIPKNETAESEFVELVSSGKTNCISREDQNNDGLYKGLSNYTKIIQPRETITNRYNQVGPIKETKNIRTVTTFDYQPDVCKDYKQTGFCGFGDSCKFLHDRGDYKAGWQLDRDWEIEQKNKKEQDFSKGDSDLQSSEEEDIPFNCVIHKGPYVRPVVTRCGHHFCEDCALKRYRKTPNCVICGAGTGGIFNKDKVLIERLKKKRLTEETGQTEQNI